MTHPRQGEIWWAEAEDKRRPVLVVSRSEAAAILHWIVVAPITRSVRNIPTEVRLDIEDGLPHPSAATMDNVQPIRRAYLTHRLGSLGPDRSADLCRALRAMADC